MCCMVSLTHLWVRLCLVIRQYAYILSALNVAQYLSGMLLSDQSGLLLDDQRPDEIVAPRIVIEGRSHCGVVWRELIGLLN